jgi:hypothetical protein
MSDDKPKREDYPPTPEGLHMWALDVQRWNYKEGVTSDALVKQWNYERKQS